MEPSATAMQSENVARIQPDDLSEMAMSLFATMLRMQTTAAPCSSSANLEAGLEASISISGNWTAQLRLRASEKLARMIACAMFNVDESELSTDDVQDAFGEAANVVGGSVKGIIDQDCDLSLPSVSPAGEEPWPEGMCQTFSCDGELLNILLIEQLQTA